jgi:hypothetical protein
MGTRYRVYLTPKASVEEYGDEIEISEWVRASLGEIRRSIDSADYSIGVFTYADLALKCDNSEGLFNDPNDSRSFFKFSRDLAKIRINFTNDAGTTITFRGLIADEATRVIAADDDIEFKVLGRDSVLRKAQVQAGTVSTGMTFQQAFNAVLNSQEITRVLGFNAANISLSYNGTVDDGSKFSKKTKKVAIDELLLASNSIMLLDYNDNIIVRSRGHRTDKDPLLLYGKGDLYGRENIAGLEDFNTGLHRVFNSIKVNDSEFTDPLASVRGVRRKEVSLDWITNADTAETIAENLVEEFKNPKTEVRVELHTDLAKAYDLLDLVSVDYPLVRTKSGRFFPVAGVTVSGDADSPVPYVSGSIVIDPNTAFKIIEIVENPQTFLTSLLLRQVGTGTSDGTFT